MRVFLLTSSGGKAGKFRKTGSIKVCVPVNAKGDYLLNGTFRYKIGNPVSYNEANARALKLKEQLESGTAKPAKKTVYGITRNPV